MSGGRIPVTLITGAAGEIGQALLHRLAEGGGQPIVTVDLRPLSAGAPGRSHREHFRGDILDPALWEGLLRRYRPTLIFHLAAILSTRAESVPVLAHRVNADGAARVLALVADLATSDEPVRFVFPSSIAVYGLPSQEAKEVAAPVSEDEHLDPATLYGAQKLYVERLGATVERLGGGLDFRAVRLPGLISSDTLPQGGTSDWAPELIHAAARSEPYSCFVHRGARLPFCAMPDAVEGILRLAFREKSSLTRSAYNLGGASLSAAEIIARVARDFPDLEVRFELDPRRDRIVASWPGAVDDAAARRDFGFAPAHDEETLFSRYLIPGIRRRYQHPVRFSR
ncbi:MAG: NAD-dependent epimerase/dehydratase family protein [Acidobacteria bacterium]|nr:NAD-dependent epimerase/dehydratase family protein [Acidobacteriota bacterium]MYF76094.1 NAD-dependent epimerase/dehydratase family protein [Acidobacteriota bacterium]MYG75390.1 NAD-dependent epimerase/dehydratase family protein [Acidobacteriota bacterium]